MAKAKKPVASKKMTDYQIWQLNEWSKTVKAPPQQILMNLAWKVYKLENSRNKC